jgi:hypothetical protein
MWEGDGMQDQGVPDSEGTGEGKGNSDSMAWFKIRAGPSMFFPWFKHPKSLILVLIALDAIWILSNNNV